jgi:hypothetical protein
MLGSRRGRARPHGAAIVLRWLAWFNGTRRPRLVARAVVHSTRWSMAEDSTTQRGRRSKWSKTPCTARSHDGSAGNDVAATIGKGE